MPKGVVRAVVLPLVTIGALGYGMALMTVSLRSRTRIVPMGGELRFCGFYLDCHLSAAVEDVTVTEGRNGRLRYVVRVRFASDARRATLTLAAPRARLVDPLDIQLAPVASVGDVTLAPDSSLVAEFLFESPFPLKEPRLWLTKGSPVERFTEKLLVGDPESVFHQPVLMALAR